MNKVNTATTTILWNYGSNAWPL